MNIDKIKEMVMECHTAIINGDDYLPYDCGDDGFYCTEYNGNEVFIEYEEVDLTRDKFYKLVLMD
jgi:hypothetical protein